MRSLPLLFIIIIIIKMKRLKRCLMLKSNQSNDDWCRNVFKRRPKVFKTGMKSTVLWYHLHVMLVLLDREKERKGRVFNIAPVIYYVYLKALRHGSHSFTCKIGTFDLRPYLRPPVWDWGTGGGVEADPQTKIFSYQCGVIFNQWGGG